MKHTTVVYKILAGTIRVKPNPKPQKIVENWVFSYTRNAIEIAENRVIDRSIARLIARSYACTIDRTLLRFHFIPGAVMGCDQMR